MNLRLLALMAILPASLWLLNPAAPYRKLFAAETLAGPADLFHPWYGSREFLLHGRDPYGPQVTQEIRSVYQGSEQRDHEWGQFSYPAYVSFLLAPTLGMSFQNVRILFVIIGTLFTALSVVAWCRILGFFPSRATLAILITLTLSSPAFVQGITLQQLGILVAAFIAAAGLFLIQGRLFLAGSVLALATIKPQMIVLLLPWLLIWMLNDWPKRYATGAGFVITLTILVCGALIVRPDWIAGWIHSMIAYRRYGGGSLVATVAGPIAGRFLTAVLLLGTAVTCLPHRSQPHDSKEFAFALASIMLLEVLIAPLMAGYNQLLMLPALLLLIQSISALRAARKEQPA